MPPLRAAIALLLFLPLSEVVGADDPIQKSLAELLAARQPEPWEKFEALPPREEVEKQLAELDSKQDADAYLPLALNYLARLPRGEKFSFHLWRSAAYAEWVERAGASLGKTPLFPALLDLGDLLPHDDPYYFETRYLRAAELARKGDLKGQRRILLTAMELPGFPDHFLASFKFALAQSLESSGETEKAIKTAASLADRIDTSAKACDALLRAGFLALESGDKKTGLKLLGKVSSAPPAALAKTVAGDLIREVAGLLSPPKKIEAHWATTEVWWPEWKALEEKLKLPPAPLTAPIVPDVRELRRTMTESAATGDIAAYFEGYRKLVHASRWLPSPVAALTDSTSLATRRLRPDLAADFRNFMVAVHRDFSSDDPDIQRRHEFYYALYLLESGNPERALKVIEKFGERPQINDVLAQGMLQLWARCMESTGGDLTLPTTVIENLLEGDERVFDRPSVVRALARLYAAQELADEERILLKRELKTPDLKANPDTFDYLSRRFEALSVLADASDEFDEAVSAWMKANRPPWFDLSEPQTLDDPTLSDLDPILRDPLAVFSNAESVKLRLLVASDPQQSLDRRYDTFIAALETLLASSPTHDAYQNLLRSVIDSDLFPNSIRIHFLWRGILEALNGYRPDQGASLLAHPLAKSLSPDQIEALEVFRPFLDADPESAESLWKLYESTAEKTPLSRGQASAILEIFSRILRLGDIEKAQAIYDASDKFVFSAEVTKKENFRLSLLRLLQIAEKSRDMNRAASEAVLAAFPAEKISRPVILDSVRGIIRLRNLPEIEARHIQIYFVKAGITGLATSDFWHDLIRSLGGGSDHLDLSLNLIKAIVDHAPGDLEKSLTILRASELIDADDPNSLERLRALLAPLRKPETDRMVKDAIALLDLGLDLRAGGAPDIESILTKIKHPAVSALAPRIRLLHYRINGDVESLRDTLQNLDPDKLLERTLLPLTIPAFETTGQKAELQLARDRAKKETPRAFADAWFAPDSSSCLTALALAETQEDPATLVPAGWIDSCLSTIKNKRAALTIKAEHARLTGDWATGLAAAEEAVKLYPTYYHFYFLKGEALHRLGRTEEAVTPLKTYVRYAKDEAHYPAAQKILSPK